MFIKSLSIAATLTLGLTASQAAFALTTPEDGQDTCLIGTKVAEGTSAVEAMLEAIATCDADIETIVRAAITASPASSSAIVEAAITASPASSSAIVEAAIVASPDDVQLIIQTARANAPSEYQDAITVIGLVNNIGPDGEVLTATAAGVEDTTVVTETTTTETTATTTLPTTTSPTPTNGGVSPS